MRTMTSADAWVAADQARADERAAEGLTCTGTCTADVATDGRLSGELVQGDLCPRREPRGVGLHRSASYPFLLRQFYLTLPRDLLDAARIDGASFRRAWWRIALPVSKTALIVVCIFAFKAKWWPGSCAGAATGPPKTICSLCVTGTYRTLGA